MTTSTAPDSFAKRIRTLLASRRITFSELSERSELAPSLVSKLLTETDSARREPRLEHVLAFARALEMTPQELVAGTHAEALLGEWVPRVELESESRARMEAQALSASLRTDLAGAAAEASALRSIVELRSQELTNLNHRLGVVEATARQEHAKLRIAKESADAKLVAALAERDHAIELARQNYQAWANARSQVQRLDREVGAAKASTAITALVASIGGAILGAAAADPTEQTISKRPRRSRRRA